jgi:hypothetical protein
MEGRIQEHNRKENFYHFEISVIAFEGRIICVFYIFNKTMLKQTLTNSSCNTLLLTTKNLKHMPKNRT